MMTFLLFALASTKWLGWRETQKTLKGPLTIGTFGDIIVQSYFNTLLRYALSVTFCEAVVMGDIGVYAIAVLSFFSSGISVILILMCGIAVSSLPAVCGFSSFWVMVFDKRRSFTVLRYCSFSLSIIFLPHLWPLNRGVSLLLIVKISNWTVAFIPRNFRKHRLMCKCFHMYASHCQQDYIHPDDHIPPAVILF